MHAATNSFAPLEDASIEDLQRLLLDTEAGARNVAPRAEETSDRAHSHEQAEARSHPSRNSTSRDLDRKYKLKNPIVWMDLEMTGLDSSKDHIMEIAVLITDGELSGPHLEGPDLVLHLPDEVLNNMNQWCTDTHGRSGLTQRCRDSTISLREAEAKVLAFLEQHTESMSVPGGQEHKAQLAGNSIYVDRAFLQQHMPRVHAHLHWRLIDVSTLLELARRWFPEEFRRAPRKKVLHTAMADIRESLNELKFYRRTIFKQPGIQYKDYLATLHGSKSHNRWGKK